MPTQFEIDEETIDRFLAVSATYFALGRARPVEPHVERRRRNRVAAPWPKSRERRCLVGPQRQYPGNSLVP